MLSTNNITMQFGSKPLFENISVKFGGGNRYGLIGANGCGKSTFMKILGGDLAPTGGNVFLDPNERLGKLRQDQFAFEQYSVLDTVIMGHTELWAVKEERDRIYAMAEMSEEDGYKVADLEVAYGEMDGYTAEARAGELLLGVGIPVEQHYGPMSEIAPGWKLRVLLAQALFSDPKFCCSTNRRTVRHRYHSLAGAGAERTQQHHDHHFARPSLPEHGLHPHGGSGLRRTARLSGQLRRIHDAATRARVNVYWPTTPRRRRRSTSCNRSSAASAPTPPNPSRPPRAPARSTRSSWK